MTFYRAAITIFRYPLRLLYRIKVINKENEPKDPYIAFINHTSFSDPLAVAAALNHEIRFVARSSLLRFGFFRWLFKKIKII
ncbi:1-acyl-sn-glycerol-3-phosphate acyltransferase, partial [Eubacteriales bacterium OttesenSCG-928-G02]|nr:1-acyl-sn-glycerol-3-phosphate acyltransferase [Eubacteriales bacterium OttesenSCG-928-G02]